MKRDVLEERLLKLIRECGVVRHGEHVLSGGGVTDVYVDLRRATLCSAVVPVLGDALFRRLVVKDVDLIGGPATGAIPVVAAAVAAFGRRQMPAWGFYTRDLKKGHGCGHVVEGATKEGMTAALVDDVVTSGQSLLACLRAARCAGLRVTHALAVVERGGGKAERKLLKEGVTFETLFTLDDLL